MKRFLLAVTLLSVLAVGASAQAGGPHRVHGHHHRHHGYYRPQVVYYPQPVCYPQQVFYRASVVYSPYYSNFNSVSLYGRNFGVQLGW